MVSKLVILLITLIGHGGRWEGVWGGYSATAAAAVASVPPKKAKAKPKTSQAKSKSKASSGPKTSSEAKQQRRQTEQQIAKTSKEIKAAEAEITKNLRQVGKLEGDIERTTETARQLQDRIDSLTARGRIVKDSINAGEAELKRLREMYVRAVRSSRKNRREMNPMTFVFSAETVRQAWRRMGYLEEFSKWRGRKTEEINSLIASLEAQKAELEDMKNKVISLRRESLARERKLRNDRQALETVVGNLKGKQKQLNTMLERQKATLANLDREIERLIQKEIEEERRREAQRREAERREAERRKKAANSSGNSATHADAPKVTSPVPPAPKTIQAPNQTAGGFAAQRGRLPSPLSSPFSVVQGFGVQQHRSIKTLEVNNPGVDLETAAGAQAKAVYPGVVSAVFVQEGLGHVVLVRHGEYLTVYANIKTLKVSKGSQLKTGDVIGTVGPSDVDSNRGQLHFEIRREREKFNPMQWLRR